MKKNKNLLIVLTVIATAVSTILFNQAEAAIQTRTGTPTRNIKAQTITANTINTRTTNSTYNIKTSTVDTRTSSARQIQTRLGKSNTEMAAAAKIDYNSDENGYMAKNIGTGTTGSNFYQQDPLHPHVRKNLKARNTFYQCND